MAETMRWRREEEDLFPQGETALLTDAVSLHHRDGGSAALSTEKTGSGRFRASSVAEPV